MDFLESNYLYLLLNLSTLSIPFLRSFEPKINFKSKWKALFPAIFITGIFFIIWDAQFTSKGIWGFNPDYILGIYFLHLPIEEWLFFIIIPYACIFIYEVLNYFLKRDYLGKIAPAISLFLAVALLLLAAIHSDKAYTSWNFLLCGFFLLIQYLFFKPAWLGRFYLAFCFGLLGFFYVNSFLTGSFTASEVVWYNANEFMGIRMGTIPVEDAFYGLLLLLMNVSFYEFFKNKMKLS